MTTHRFFLLALLFSLITIEAASAQQVWTRGNTFGHVAGLSSVYMIDSLDGWAVGSQGRILRTSDAGESWGDESLDSSFQLNDVTFFDDKKGVIVGGILMNELGEYFEPIALYTRDGGRSWRRSLVLDWSGWGGGGGIEEVVVAGSRMAAVASGMLLVSIDSGATWTREYIPGGPFSPIIWDLFVGPDGELYVFANDGLIFRASEDGTEWTYAGGFRKGTEGWENIAFAVPTPVIRIMLDTRGEIIRSTDSGRSWSSVATIDTRSFDPMYMYWAGARFHFPDAANGLLVAPNGKLYTTSDTGATWSEASIPTDIIRSQFPSRFIGYAVDASRILKTTDGGQSWQPKSRVYGVDFRSIAFSQTGQWPAWWYTVGDRGAFGYSSNGGEDWEWLYSGTSQRLNDISITAGLFSYIVGDSGTILRGRLQYGVVTSPLPNWNLLAVEAIGEQKAVAVGYDYLARNGVIVRTADSGKQWKIIEHPGTEPLRDIYFIDDIYGYTVGDGGTILRTEDGGITWSSRAADGLSGSAEWSFSSVHFINRETGMVVGTGPWGGITLHTSDAGLSWRIIDGPTTGVDHKVVRMRSRTHATLLTSRGTITTEDGGATWKQEQRFEGETLFDMDFARSGRGVIVGMTGAVYYSGSMVSAVGEERRVMPWEKLYGPMLH